MGADRWVESRLFEALGSWVPMVAEPEVQVFLAAQAREHAWHGELWQEQLPTAGELTPERLTTPANEGLAAFVTALADHEGSGHTIEKLVGAYRVLLPRVIAAYSAHLAATSAISDGPVIRALRLVVRDEVEGWSRGEALIHSLLRTEEQVRSAALHQARLEWAIALAGGVTGSDAAVGGFAGQGNGQP